VSRALRTPGLPPAHGPVGYRWQNTGSSISLINTRATSCRTGERSEGAKSPVGVGASVWPELAQGPEVPEPTEGICMRIRHAV